jgi:hypothetical protein
VTGDEIINLFNVLPGPVIGEIKDQIKEAILDGIIKNDRDEAWQLMLDIASKKGLTLKS